MTSRALNGLEKAEFLFDRGSSANLNFAAVSSYTGPLNKEIVQKGLSYLQKMHPLLRVNVLTSTEKVTQFIETNGSVPFKEYSYQGPNQWKEVVKQEMSPRFTKEDEPLWRVSLLKGDNEGQLIVTVHHVITDTVCLMQMMNHLYQILSQLLKDESPHVKEIDIDFPDLKSLYPLCKKEPTEEPSPPSRTDKGYHTNFVKDVIDENTTSKILKWTKEQGIKANGTLFAALLLAVKKVVNPNFEDFTAVTAVNYRPYFTPPVSKETFTLLRAPMGGKCSIQNKDFAVLAQEMHQRVHAMLEDGDHIFNLKLIENRLSKDISSEELWKRMHFPDNGIGITNVGALDFSGKYGNLSLNELFFVANAEPFMDQPTNFILAILTFQGKLFPCLWFIEELVDESVGQKILSEMKLILSQL